MDPISLGLSVASTAFKAVSGLQKGKAEKRAAYERAALVDYNANERYAQGTREAFETRRQGNALQSDAVAAIASGGGSSADAGSVQRLSEIKSVTDYNSLAVLYEGDSAYRGLKRQARNLRKGGRRANKAGVIGAATTVLRGASDIYGVRKA